MKVIEPAAKVVAVIYGIVESDFNYWKIHWVRSELAQAKVEVPSYKEIALPAGISFAKVLQITYPYERITILLQILVPFANLSCKFPLSAGPTPWIFATKIVPPMEPVLGVIETSFGWSVKLL